METLMSKSKPCAVNERRKYEFLEYQAEARGKSETSIDQIAAAIDLYQDFTACRDFKTFKPKDAKSFKRWLLDEPSPKTGKPRAASSVSAILRCLKDFFIWLADRPGYRSRLNYADADYFSLTDRDNRTAHCSLLRPHPTQGEVQQALEAMPDGTEIERRDRALFALAVITGARMSALRTLRLKHIDIGRSLVRQDGKEVHTKNGKSFLTPFYPISDLARDVVEDWHSHLMNKVGWSDDAPFFPKQRIAPGATGAFNTHGLDPAPYASDSPLREVFADAFARAGLSNYDPHTIRHMSASIGANRSLTPAEMKAWSMGLGHENLATTMARYVRLSPEDQLRRMGEIGANATPNLSVEAALAVIARSVRH